MTARILGKIKKSYGAGGSSLVPFFLGTPAQEKSSRAKRKAAGCFEMD